MGDLDVADGHVLGFDGDGAPVDHQVLDDLSGSASGDTSGAVQAHARLDPRAGCVRVAAGAWSGRAVPLCRRRAGSGCRGRRRGRRGDAGNGSRGGRFAW